MNRGSRTHWMLVSLWMVAPLCVVCSAPAQAATRKPAPIRAQAVAEVPLWAPKSFERITPVEKAQLGEPFRYVVTLRHEKDFRYELRHQDLGAFELLDERRDRRDDGTSITTFELRLAGFDLGKQKLPELTFEVVGPAGAGTWQLPGSDFEIVATETNSSGLHDDKPPTEVWIQTYRVLWAFLAVILLAAAAWVAWRLWKLKQRPVRVLPPPPLPLHQRTRVLLMQLQKEDLPGKGDIKLFYVRLSEILRGYLGERYSFEALECTSTELMEALRKKHTPGLPLDAFGEWVTETDLVKFAKAVLGPAECKRALELAVHIVDQTPFPVPSVPTAQRG